LAAFGNMSTEPAARLIEAMFWQVVSAGFIDRVNQDAK
jgi:hypothetical protein